MKEAQKKVSDIFDKMQTLNIYSHKSNVETFLQILYDLQDVYQMLEEKAGDEDNGRDTADIR